MSVDSNKRIAEQDHPAQRSRRDSEVRCRDLPLEIWEKIAIFLDKKDIHNLSTVSKLHKSAALNAAYSLIHNSTKKQLLEFAQQPVHVKSELACYRNILKDLVFFQQITPNQEQNALNELANQLQVFVTHKVAHELLNASQSCMQEINKDKISIPQIQQKYSEQKLELILSLLHPLEKILSETQDPQRARGIAVSCAAQNEYLDIVKYLFRLGDISDAERGCALTFAARGGNLEMVNLLLQSGRSSEEDLLDAFLEAAAGGYLDIVRQMLAHTRFSQEDRGFAFEVAAGRGFLNIMEFLSSGGRKISAEFIGRALAQAAKNGQLQIVNHLLSNNEISIQNRSVALENASKSGFYEVVKSLLSKGGIVHEHRVTAVLSAAENGHSEILEVLLEGHVLTKEDRSWAVRCAAIGCHTESVKILLQNGPISDSMRIMALISAVSFNALDMTRHLLDCGPIPQQDRQLLLTVAQSRNNHEVHQMLQNNS